ncbi:unnamed protein product, partial [Ixodes hexagonus]
MKILDRVQALMTRLFVKLPLVLVYRKSPPMICLTFRKSYMQSLFLVNELPVAERFQHCTVAGLWFGKGHPSMTLFLEQFVEGINNMSPVVWEHEGITHTSQAYVVCWCLDAPARAAVQNCILYNGYIGCPWCLTRGEYLDETMLRSFVSMTGTLYGASAMTFNVHQLLHLPEAARQMGPLWGHSAFVFEGGNGRLVKLVKGASAVPQQIVERVVMAQQLEQSLASPLLSDRVKCLCKNML